GNPCSRSIARGSCFCRLRSLSAALPALRMSAAWEGQAKSHCQERALPPNNFVFHGATKLVDFFAFAVAPCEAVGCSLQRHHSQPVLAVRAGRVAGNDDGISDLKRVPVDSVSCQLTAACPFNGPPLSVGRFDVNEGMRITEQKLDHFSFDLHLLR